MNIELFSTSVQTKAPNPSLSVPIFLLKFESGSWFVWSSKICSWGPLLVIQGISLIGYYITYDKISV